MSILSKLVSSRPYEGKSVSIPSATPARVGGGDLLANVGATLGETAGATVLYGGGALALGAFSYALFTGGWGFKTTHPVWGALFLLSAASAAVTAGNKILNPTTPANP